MGISFVFPILSDAASMVTGPVTMWCREQIRQMFPPKFIDVDGDGDVDFEVPSHPLVHHIRFLAPSILINVAIQLVSAGIFCAFENQDTYKPDGSLERKAWTYWDAIYHCVVTGTTVGYGDVKIATQGGRLWSSFHMCISAIMVAELLSAIGVSIDERNRLKSEAGRLAKRASKKLYKRVTACAAKANFNLDGKGLKELEFAVCMLMELGLIEWDELNIFIKKFRNFDVDKTGILNLDDVRGREQSKGEDVSGGAHDAPESFMPRGYLHAPLFPASTIILNSSPIMSPPLQPYAPTPLYFPGSPQPQFPGMWPTHPPIQLMRSRADLVISTGIG